jgi:hypothetical protein
LLAVNVAAGAIAHEELHAREQNFVARRERIGSARSLARDRPIDETRHEPTFGSCRLCRRFDAPGIEPDDQDDRDEADDDACDEVTHTIVLPGVRAVRQPVLRCWS